MGGEKKGFPEKNINEAMFQIITNKTNITSLM